MYTIKYPPLEGDTQNILQLLIKRGRILLILFFTFHFSLFTSSQTVGNMSQKDYDVILQMNIGKGNGSTAVNRTNRAAYLEIGDSLNSTKALLIPRGDTTDVTFPIIGLLFYNLSDSTIYQYNGSAWTGLGSGTGGVGGNLNTTLHLGNTSDTSIILTANAGHTIGVSVSAVDNANIGFIAQNANGYASLSIMDEVGNLILHSASGTGLLSAPASGDWQYLMPSGNGTLALTSDIPSITGKLNISDTASMLSPYLRKADSTALSGYATQYDLTQLSSSGLDAVLAVDGHSPTITDEVNIIMGGNGFNILNADYYNLGSLTNELFFGKSGGVYIEGTGSSTSLLLNAGISSTRKSEILLLPDSTKMNFGGGGAWSMDSLRDGAAYNMNKLFGWGSGSKVVGSVAIGTGLDLTSGVLSATGGGGLGTLDTLINPKWDVVQDVSGASYKSHRKPVFNVKDFGAIADNSTDAQPSIQRAIDSAFAHRDEYGRKTGGVVLIPSGMYALTSTAASGMHLKIPLSSYFGIDSAVTIEIEGETAPVPWTNPLSDATQEANPPTTGTVLRSTLLSNTAIIGTEGASTPWGTFNFGYLTVKNLGLRLRSKTGITQVAPQGTGINWGQGVYINIDNIRIDTESPTDSTVEPTSTCFGVIFPPVNNWVQNSITNSTIEGTYTALKVGEHFKGWNTQIDGNYYGLVTYSTITSHLIDINGMGFWRNKYHIQINGTSYISGTNVRLESKTSGAEWFVNVADIDEPSPGTSFGSIGYHRVIATVGANNAITRTNSSGSNISTYPAVNGPTYVSGYGRGLMENLKPGELAAYDFKAVGNAANMIIGSASSTYPGSGAIVANDAFLYTPNGDMTLMATLPDAKLKLAIGFGTGQTHYFDINGYHYSSSTQANFLGSVSGYPGLWLGTPANSPTFTDYAILQDGPNEQTVFNGTGSVPSINFRLNNGATSTLIYKGDKLGVGFANTGSPISKLHVTGSIRGTDSLLLTGLAATLVEDTTNYKLLTINSSGNVRKMFWPAGGGYTTLAQFIGETNWTTGYINGSGDYTALALGSSGKVLTSNGASSAPTWETPTTGYTTLSQFVGETNWQNYYSNGSGDITGQTVGAANTVWLGNGVTSAPTWGTVPNAALTNSTISGIALGSNLANLTATDATLTFSGTYNGSTARTIGLNLGNANTWSADQTVPDEIYDATNWNGNLEVPTKNAVRDKIEALIAAGTPTFQQVLTAGSTLSGANTVSISSNDFTIDGTTGALRVFTTNASTILRHNSATTNTNIDMLDLQRFTSGAAGSGISGGIKFTVENSSGVVSANEIRSKLTTVTAAAEVSELDIMGVNTSQETYMRIKTGGIVIVNNLTDTLATKAYARSIGTSTSGVAASPTASGTETITHGLGRIPTIIRIYSIGGFVANAAALPTSQSMGIFNSSGNRCVFQRYDATTITAAEPSETSTTFAIFIGTGNGNFISGVIQNVTSTGFDIVWTETGTATAQNYMWEAQ